MPEELIMDVNKAPHPIVNVIAEAPATTKFHTSLMESQRQHEQMRERAFEAKQDDFDKAAAHELLKQNAMLQRLKNLRSVARGSF